MKSFLPIQSTSLLQLTVCPETIIETAQFGPISVQDHQGQAIAILISAKHFKDLLDRIDDLELACVVQARRGEIGRPIEIDEI